MSRSRRVINKLIRIVLIGSILLPSTPLSARVVEMKSGWELSGKTGVAAGFGAAVLKGAAAKGASIAIVDDGLRRTFVAQSQVNGIREEEDKPELIRLKQNPRPAIDGNKIGRIGLILRATPFDIYGRRTVTTQAPDRQLNIVQGITEITPTWTRVQGLQSAKPYAWDMRVATNSIPREQLRKIIGKYHDLTDADVRLSLVRLYIESEQFGPAEAELNAAIKAFPKLEKMKQQVRTLRQLKAKQQLGEIELRKANGQHGLARALLQNFPDEGIAQETLLTASEMEEEYVANVEKKVKILKALKEQIDQIQNAPEREMYEDFYKELDAELNHNSLPRLAAYFGLLEDKTLERDQKMALALSGWMLDGNGTENLAIAASTWEVRKIVREYLVTTNVEKRKELLEKLSSQEAGGPKYVAQILAGMKPPRRTDGLYDRLPDDEEVAAPGIPPQQPDTPLDGNGDGTPKVPGHFVLQTEGMTEGSTIEYHVQLPPEYDANRRYPTIVTLHGAGGTPENQINWWAGQYDAKMNMRLGQAARHGYIVIAPVWTKPKQRRYEYSAKETAAVLYSLRDSFHRFSIDTDRIFLSGHSMGGDAVWDMALAHPDLWAGVIPISAVAKYDGKDSPNYISRYWENGKHVAFYFIVGGFDKAKMDANGQDFNRYLQHSGFDTTVTEFLGRGHEHFHEDIHRIFSWMHVHQRDPSPTEINATVMRPWDRFFWWFEVDGFPEGSTVLPGAWPAKKVRPTQLTAKVRERKNVLITTSTRKAKVFLTEDLVDLSANVTITVNSNRRRLEEKASAKTMLEDARRRGDRKHPFWIELDLKTGRGGR